MAHRVNDVEVTRQLLRSLAPSATPSLLICWRTWRLSMPRRLWSGLQRSPRSCRSCCDALGVDPAVVSAPLITTVVDGTGLIIYFSVANRFLGL